MVRPFKFGSRCKSFCLSIPSNIFLEVEKKCKSSKIGLSNYFLNAIVCYNKSAENALEKNYRELWEQHTKLIEELNKIKSENRVLSQDRASNIMRLNDHDKLELNEWFEKAKIGFKPVLLKALDFEKLFRKKRDRMFEEFIVFLAKRGKASKNVGLLKNYFTGLLKEHNASCQDSIQTTLEK